MYAYVHMPAAQAKELALKALITLQSMPTATAITENCEQIVRIADLPNFSGMTLQLPVSFVDDLIALGVAP